ncbi:Protein naked cuticle 1 [Liparis tanakae]|uniref:Protein naked cuticle 1 n=1 Tax=Liparis tanakae TaxID=230148 RepID=A0A4Z2ESZ4_9TELE|nr:Protein naked cuticle 1 [Liparis tanakae]
MCADVLWERCARTSSRLRFFVSGDSFVVSACLARKGIDDWLAKQSYYCASARLEPRDGPRARGGGGSAPPVSAGPRGDRIYSGAGPRGAERAPRVLRVFFFFFCVKVFSLGRVHWRLTFDLPLLSNGEILWNGFRGDVSLFGGETFLKGSGGGAGALEEKGKEKVPSAAFQTHNASVHQTQLRPRAGEQPGAPRAEPGSPKLNAPNKLYLCIHMFCI